MKKGFTLVELMVAISIIGILSSIAFGSITASRQKARDNAHIADLKNLELAMALYYDVNKTYPPAGKNAYNSLTILTTDKYIAALPIDMKGEYAYKFVGNKYCLGVKLDGPIPDDAPEVQARCAASGPNYYWVSR
jgi:prepilin-type N-terminal cleavage/methylation domain-containing protein